MVEQMVFRPVCDCSITDPLFIFVLLHDQNIFLNARILILGHFAQVMFLIHSNFIKCSG